MKAGRSVFINSAVFGIVISVVYWFSSHHPGGTLLLGFMASAMIFAAGFMFVAQREANLASDKKNVTYAHVAGQEVGSFTISTGAPFLAALTVFGVFVGLLWSPFLAAVSFVLMLLVLGRLAAESNRTERYAVRNARQKSLQK